MPLIACQQKEKGEIKMSQKDIINTIEALNEWEAIIADAQAEADALRDSIKAEMLRQDVEELQAGQYIVRYANVLSQRFATTDFKKAMPEIYKAYLKQVASRRFSISD